MPDPPERQEWDGQHDSNTTKDLYVIPSDLILDILNITRAGLTY